MKTDNISEKLNRVFEKLAQNAQEDAQIPRKSTGFSDIDRLTTGLADGDLVVVFVLGVADAVIVSDHDA